MAYQSETSPTSRAIGFGLVVLFHVAIVYALATGLATTMVEVIKGPLQTEILTEQKKDEAAPPPPPPQTLKPPPVYVPPVEVNVAPETTTNSTAIQAVSNAHTNPKAIVSDPVEYPSDASHLKVEGDALFQIDVDEHGRVKDEAIRFIRFENLVNSTPQIEAEFQHNGLEYIKKMRFKAATNAGTPVAASNIPIRVRFRCKDPSAPGGSNC